MLRLTSDYNREYVNARICRAEKWRKPLAKFLRQSHFISCDNSDLVTHEVMVDLKNVYIIKAAPMVAAIAPSPSSQPSMEEEIVKRKDNRERIRRKDKLSKNPNTSVRWRRVHTERERGNYVPEREVE
ncbi:hypothetical protein LguiA_033414 [Lonicera macranthoides]